MPSLAFEPDWSSSQDHWSDETGRLDAAKDLGTGARCLLPLQTVSNDERSRRGELTHLYEGIKNQGVFRPFYPTFDSFVAFWEVISVRGCSTIKRHISLEMASRCCYRCCISFPTDVKILKWITCNCLEFDPGFIQLFFGGEERASWDRKTHWDYASIHIDCVRCLFGARTHHKLSLPCWTSHKYSVHWQQPYLALDHRTHTAVRLRDSSWHSHGDGLLLVAMASHHKWEHVIWVPISAEPPPFVSRDLKSRPCLHDGWVLSLLNISDIVCLLWIQLGILIEL